KPGEGVGDLRRYAFAEVIHVRVFAGVGEAKNGKRVDRSGIRGLIWVQDSPRRNRRPCEQYNHRESPELPVSTSEPRWACNVCSSRVLVTLKPLQVSADVRGVLVTQVPVFLQTFLDDFFQFRRDLRVDSDRRLCGAIEDRLEYHSGSAATKRQNPRRHLI